MKIRTVDDRRGLREFIDLPFRLHAAEPLWAPPLRADVRARLDRSRNPFFQHAEAEYFRAERNGRTVGRIAAISNHRHDEIYGDGVGFFGFFESEDDPAVARALLDTAAGWLSERGYAGLRGPASFSTNDECGLLIHGFDDAPTIMMPYNPRSYVGLLEDAGFRKSRDLLAFGGAHPDRVPGRSEELVESQRCRLGVEMRGLRRADFPAEVERIKRGYTAAWQRHWGFVPMSDPEIDHLARQFRPVHVPDLVPFAEIDGKLVGFGLAIPDLNEVLRSNRSGRMLPGALKLLWALKRRTIRRLRVLLLGILPDCRGRGVDAMLWQWISRRAIAHGFRSGEAGWIVEDNTAMCDAARENGYVHRKTYRLYERSIVGQRP